MLYYNLLIHGQMTEHLYETEQRALQMEETLVQKIAAQEGVTESLKATDMMSWVRKMNNIRNRAQEIVKTDVVFA